MRLRLKSPGFTVRAPALRLTGGGLGSVVAAGDILEAFGGGRLEGLAPLPEEIVEVPLPEGELVLEAGGIGRSPSKGRVLDFMAALRSRDINVRRSRNSATAGASFTLR